MNATNRQIVLIIVAVVATVALPILAAIMVARDQASEHEEHLVAHLAQGALQRAEQAADQIAAGSRAINALPQGGACSPEGRSRMRRVDLESTLLQAVAHYDGEAVDCSSFAGPHRFEIGPPDVIGALGVRHWTRLRPFDGRSEYIGIAQGSFMGIIHKDLLLSFVDDVEGLAIGTFNRSSGKMLLSRGAIDPRWIAPAGAQESLFRTDDHVVATARSARYDIGTIAVLPRSREALLAQRQGIVLIPLGLIAGLFLSVLLVRVLRSRMSMPMMIRSALRGGEFHLVYQPEVDLATGRTTGAEELIRWRRPNGETIPPDNFIGVAEEAGVIRLITARVLELLAEDARAVLRLNPDFRFSVNFSADDLQSPAIFDEVATFVRRAGLGFDNLVIEATERSFMDLALAQDAIDRLREAGVRVAIDDFGTGYSSLGYLARLKLDVLKIDRLFVQALGTASATSQVINRIVDMAKDLNLKIVAEGIETAEQAEQLRALGVDHAQGYHFGRPMAMDMLLERLQTERSSVSNVAKFPARAA